MKAWETFLKLLHNLVGFFREIYIEFSLGQLLLLWNALFLSLKTYINWYGVLKPLQCVVFVQNIFYVFGYFLDYHCSILFLEYIFCSILFSFRVAAYVSLVCSYHSHFHDTCETTNVFLLYDSPESTCVLLA